MSDYGTPPPPPPAPGYDAPAAGGTPPPNYLIWAILSTVFCCLPLGIASIVFAAQVNGKWAAGDVAGAMDSSKKARNFALWGTVVGLILLVVYVLLLVGGVMTSRGTSYQ